MHDRRRREKRFLEWVLGKNEQVGAKGRKKRGAGTGKEKVRLLQKGEKVMILIAPFRSGKLNDNVSTRGKDIPLVKKKRTQKRGRRNLKEISGSIRMLIRRSG